MTDDEWHRVVDVSLTGTFRCTRSPADPLCAGLGCDRQQRVRSWSGGPRPDAGAPTAAAGQWGHVHSPAAPRFEGRAFGVRSNAVARQAWRCTRSLPRSPATSCSTSWPGARRSAQSRGEEATVIVPHRPVTTPGYMTGEVVSVSSQHPRPETPMAQTVLDSLDEVCGGLVKGAAARHQRVAGDHPGPPGSLRRRHAVTVTTATSLWRSPTCSCPRSWRCVRASLGVNYGAGGAAVRGAPAGGASLVRATAELVACDEILVACQTTISHHRRGGRRRPPPAW